MISPGARLDDVQDWIKEKMRDGCVCLACGQDVKVYSRPIDKGQAISSIMMFKAAGQDWVHVPTLFKRLGLKQHDIAKLRNWDLVEEEKEMQRKHVPCYQI